MEMLKKMKKMDMDKKIDPMKLKAAGAGLLFVKLFGIGKSLMFLAGGVAGFLLACKMERCKDEQE